MKLEFITGEGMGEVSRLSQAVGNIPLLPGESLASTMRNTEGDIVAFAAVTWAWHAAGSWVRPDLRKRRYTYELRDLLERELRGRGVRVYFAIPNTEFERTLFAKYGAVTERIVQVKEL